MLLDSPAITHALTGVGPMPSAHERRLALRAALAADAPLVLPGITDALGARLVETAGFAAAYATGAGLANAQHGVPDLGLISLGEVVDHVGRLTEATRLPVVVDADTGYGGPLATMRTIRLLERAGAAAIQLEDQEMPKRCGHFDDHALIPTGHMQTKLAAAVDARTDDALVIIARTDARSVHDIEEAITRGKAYVEAGADLLFIEAPRTVEELALVGQELAGVPLLVNVVEGGRTPELELKEYVDLGFGVILFANYLMRSMMRAGREALTHLAEHGETRTRADRMASWAERQSLVHLPEFTAAETALDQPWDRFPMIPGLPYATELPDRVGVLVLGSGLAGCAALLAAAEAGQFAVMLEKTSEIGGSTVKSAGLSAFAGTDEQQAQGIADSVELLRKDLLEVGRHRNDERLVDLYCDHQLDTYHWLRRHGVQYGEVHAASGQSAPRSHPTDTTAMLVHLLRAAGRLGARLLLDTPAHRLVREEGRVVGVDVHTPDGLRRVLADAVVVATGGFAQNPGLLARFAPQMANALRAGGDGCEGDGLLMAWQLGAGVVDTPYIKATYGHFHKMHPDEDGTGILAVYKGAIAVNREGRRFVDESLNYKEIGDHALAQPGVTTYQVFDARVLAASSDEVPIYDFTGRESAGLLVRADSIAELEERLGLPDGSLVETVDAYNAATRSDSPDPLGREHLSGGVGSPFPLDQPPFYAHPSGSVVLATYCGLTVDTDLRVLDVFGEPIERLYAAGEVIGGFHGAGYITGTSIGKAGIFGRIAGTHAAAEESELEW